VDETLASLVEISEHQATRGSASPRPGLLQLGSFVIRQRGFGNQLVELGLHLRSFGAGGRLRRPAFCGSPSLGAAAWGSPGAAMAGALVAGAAGLSQARR
jgi:hypothetical protein